MQTVMAKYLSYMMSIIFAVSALSGCYSIDDTQKEWTEKGETIYVGKLDSLIVRSGFNRVEIVGNTRYVRTATNCTVEFGEGEIMTYNMSDVVGDDGLARLVVDGLEGGSYYFEVMTYDDKGHKSVPSTVYGIAYGEADLLVQSPRRISEIIPKYDGSVDLKWNDAESTYVELVYEDADGKSVTLKIENDPEVTNIKSWKKGGEISVKTFIKLKETDLDMMVLEPMQYNFPEKIKQSVPRFGEGSIMDLGSSADWNLLESFTVELKVRYTELAGGDQCIISCEGSSPNSGFMLRGSGSNVQFYIGDGGWTGVGFGPLAVGEWYDLAVTYEAEKSIDLYVNGEKKASKNISKPMLESVYNLHVGTSPLYSSRYMRGDVQHISIWSQAKTESEIKTDVEQSYGFSGNENGLKAYWPLTVNYGDQVPDQTGQHMAVFTKVIWNEQK